MHFPTVAPASWPKCTPHGERGWPARERVAVTCRGARVPVELSLTAVTYEGNEAALAAVRDITDRKRADEALRRSQQETIEHHQRLLALSQSAQAVQRAQSAEEVYEVIGYAVKQQGFQAAVLRMAQDPSYLAVDYWTFDSTVLRAAEKLAGRSAQDIRLRLDPDEALQQVLSQGESAFFQKTADRISRGIPALGRLLIERLVEMLGIDRSIYAPLRLGGETTGILMVAGPDLSESDVPAIAILANQAGIAIENAQLLENQRASRSACNTSPGRLYQPRKRNASASLASCTTNLGRPSRPSRSAWNSLLRIFRLNWIRRANASLTPRA